VSRPTFYQHFSERSDCLAKAAAEINAELLVRVREEVARAAGAGALGAALGANVCWAAENQQRARFVMHGPLGGDAAVLAARDDAIDAQAEAVARAERAAPEGAPTPELPAQIAIGTAQRMLAARLRRGEPNLTALRVELERWAASYARPREQHAWRRLAPHAAPWASAHVPAEALRAPGPVRGRGERSHDNQRLRIVYALAELAERDGFAATKVSDITSAAGVDGRTFYALFKDKQDAFIVTHELGFQRVMEATAAGFFSAGGWRQRNWEAGRAFTQFLAQNPMFAKVGFVEAYAGGAVAAQRLEDSRGAFAMLLQDGYRHLRQPERPSRLALEAIVTAVYEVVYREARAGRAHLLPRLIGNLTHLVLSPFETPAGADRFIRRRLLAEQR
jgi:AcrR family transcriptional regulator